MLDLKYKTIKLLEDNIREKPLVPRVPWVVLRYDPKNNDSQ